MMKIQMRLSASISQKPVQRVHLGIVQPVFGQAPLQDLLCPRRSAMAPWPDGPATATSTATPSSSEGMPSSSSIHCQPCSRPLNPSSQPEIGAPITLAAGTAARNKRDEARPRRLGKPVGHVEDHAGIEPGLGQRPAEIAAHKKMIGPCTKAVAMETRPQVTMMRHIQIRAPTFSSIRFGGHLEEEIAEEEDARAEAVDLGGKSQILIHGQRGEADIHPVQEAHHIHQRT